MKTTVIVLSLLYSLTASFAQNSINQYKYVIVPAQYEFLGTKDKYQLNSLTKFLFNKYGYNALMNDEQLPEDLSNDGCLAMYADLENKKGLLKTKVQFHLKDCNGRIIQSSKVGETKEKQLEKSFQLALRDAFETYRDLGYTYTPNTVNKNDDEKLPIPKSVEDKIKKEHKETDRLVEAINKDTKEAIESDENKVVPSVVVTGMPDTTDVEISEEDAPKKKDKDYSLYAQPIQNGYQIVDTEPKKVMVLYESGLDNIYIVEGKDAIVYEKDGQWVYSESGSETKVRILNIKF